MPISRATEPITADDETVRTALKDAFLPALLPALAHATGDLDLLPDDLRPIGMTPGIEQGGMTAEQQQAARDLAFKAIVSLRDAPVDVPFQPDENEIRRITTCMTGSASSDEYIPMLLQQLALADDSGAPEWHADPAASFTVAIIGAGMSGILAGIRLKQAGVPFVIIEKNTDVGGTWFENTYPGARVDVSNASYSYSFAQKIDWPKHFSTQEILLDYFRACADEYGVREHIRFGTEVHSAVFDDDRSIWTLRLRSPDGGDETIEAQAVISAVGQLNRPNTPDISGMESFEGQTFHSARWNHDIDLTGKRVAVIGNGASAAQFIPVIAKDAAQLHIFQRTPNWFVPVPHYHDDVPAGLRWLFLHIPHYAHWYRFWLFWTTGDGLLAAARVDKSWQDQARSVSPENDMLRVLLTGYLQSQFQDRPDLLAKVVPSYPPAAKRIVLDNGVWAETLKRENVDLITELIREITPSGVRTADGVEYAADVIIYATGFQASRFLTPMSVTGRGGVELAKQWSGDARAYMGITVPGFPNFFLLYGPNTNIVVNGSIIYFSECEVRYVLGCIRLLLEEGRDAMDCKPEVHDSYNERVDAGNLQMAWGASTVNSWYKNDKGRVSQNWPFDLIEYWRQTKEPDPADYVFL